jgi:HTH-type transcriptional regulator / antitoxin HigA
MTGLAMTKPLLKFEPDYAVAPGETLKEVLLDKGISQTALAVRAGMTEKNISQIVNGLAPITYETAEKFEMALGIPARFWNQREQAYRELQVRFAATERMKADLHWLDEIPVAALKARGFIESEATGESLVRQALKFFGVSSVVAWREAWEELWKPKLAIQFRGGDAKERRPGYVAAWLRMGDLQAETVSVAPYHPDAFRRVLTEARTMTNLPAKTWVEQLATRSAAAGVVVLVTKEIPSAAVSGATRWITKDKALIQLSLKFKSTDQIWFTFFHEAGHILLHGKKQVFVEFGNSAETDEEREANAFARDWLIPREDARRLPQLKSRSQILAFAKTIGVAPGIVVGRLQHEGLAYQSAFNDLKRKLTWEA